MTAQPKYRPSLTLDQINRLMQKLDTSDPAERVIHRVLRSISLKASEGIIQPAFVSIPKASLDDSLGFAQDSSIHNVGASLWKMHCEGTKLSDKQVLDAWGYAFTNDLLTPEQELEYTSRLMQSSSSSSTT